MQTIYSTMVVLDDEQILEQGLRDYNEHFKMNLEITNLGDYFVYDPITKDHFVSSNLSSGLFEMRRRYPGRVFFSIRIGEKGVYKFER